MRLRSGERHRGYRTMAGALRRLQRLLRYGYAALRHPRNGLWLAHKALGIYRREGWRGVKARIFGISTQERLAAVPVGPRRGAASHPLALTEGCLPDGREPEPTALIVRVGVIIPVYGGLEETRRCVESVLGARNETPFRLVVINDCSPEPAIVDYLNERAREGRIELLHNAQNQGFVRTVNRGMSHLAGYDVILLNSDTEVANNWIDRLALHAYSGGRVATVTPFSNNATICSYPDMVGRTYVPGGLSVAAMDRVFQRANAGRSVEIPSAVGFCMYIRRDCLDALGDFDAETYGHGYGEENDFCMRALDAGWRHLLAGDVFVFHRGGVSFVERTDGRKQEATRRLLARYPQYPTLVSRFVQSDPARPLRVAASLQRYRDAGQPVLLMVTHALGGGTAQHIDELAGRVGPQAAMLRLRRAEEDALWLESLDDDDPWKALVALPDTQDLLVRALRAAGVSRVHVHHWMGINYPLRKLVAALDVPLDFTVHDYYSICPQVFLVHSNGSYCGEPSLAKCNRCILERPAATNILWWRKQNEWLLADAERVICPSRDVAQRLQRYNPHRPYLVVHHRLHDATPLARAPRSLDTTVPLRVALLGIVAPHKGLRNLIDVSRAAAKAKAPLEFTVIGAIEPSTEIGIGFHSQFRQTGPYESGDLPRLLAEAAPDLVWFASVCPETFSFTLSDALAAGLPVVVPNLGSFPERVAERPWSWVIDWDWTPERILSFFLDIRERHFVSGQAPSPPPPNPPPPAGVLTLDTDAFYPARYMQGE